MKPFTLAALFRKDVAVQFGVPIQWEPGPDVQTVDVLREEELDDSPLLQLLDCEVRVGRHGQCEVDACWLAVLLLQSPHTVRATKVGDSGSST